MKKLFKASLIISAITCYLFFCYSQKQEEEKIVKWIEEKGGSAFFAPHPLTAKLPKLLKPASKVFLGKKAEKITIPPMKDYEPIKSLSHVKSITVNFSGFDLYSFNDKEETDILKILLPKVKIETLNYYILHSGHLDQSDL